MDEPDPDRVAFEGCTRFLSFGSSMSMRERLLGLAALPEAEGRSDIYGCGGPVQVLEQRVADLLGKPMARFLMKGVVAQQAVLRAWSERSGHRAVVVHPESHLAYDEDGALEQLHPIRAVRLGGADNFTVEELDKVGEPLAAVSVELPLRRAGFRLPSWDELTAISSWCNERDIALHLDGARLWEAQTYYDRPLDEIAGLADSVYVSFYKGLGGLAGCAIAAESQLLDAASPWIARLGGPVFATYPYALAAIQGLDERLPRMGAYHKRAVQLAQALEGVDGVIVERPKATGFRLHLHGEPELLRAQHRAVAEDTKMWLFGFIGPSPVVGYAVVEVQIGESSFELTDEEIRSGLERIVAVEE